MRGIVHSPNTDSFVIELDLVDTAWILYDPPVGGERHREPLRQHHAIYAVVPDHNDGLVGMALLQESHRARCSRSHILQHFTARKSYAIGRLKPCGKQRGIGSLSFFPGFSLPIAVVNIRETGETLRGNTARCGDGSSGLDTSAKRTRVDNRGRPVHRHASCDLRRLLGSKLGERKIRAAAKARRLNSGDMSMSYQ